MAWKIKSIDFMKLTQDVADAKPPVSLVDIDVNAALAKELGATHMAISTPYDLPNGGGDVIVQAKNWVDAARRYGLNVWHRHSWCSDQGWYGVPQDITNDRLKDTRSWILAHPEFFESGDIFTPKPEPQNMGVIGMNSGGNARFQSIAAFNKWIRDSMVLSSEAFSTLGIQGVQVGYWGFDGFVVCGYGNPDWQGKSFLEMETVKACGNVLAVDHYPELVGKPMTDFLSVFKTVWPGVNYIAGEWGAAGNTDPLLQIHETMGALAQDEIVTGVNYWHMGPGQSEALLNDDLTKKPAFDAVKAFFTSTPPTPQPVPVPPVPADGFRGEYFDNQTLHGMPRLIRQDQAINFDWGSGSPDLAIPADHFSVRWTRVETFENAPYDFSLIVDDGGRLYLDDVLLIDAWKDQSATSYGKRQNVTAGKHTIKFEYYENAGGAVAKLAYKKAATPIPVPVPTPAPMPVPNTVSITGTVTITTDNAGKVSITIAAKS